MKAATDIVPHRLVPKGKLTNMKKLSFIAAFARLASAAFLIAFALSPLATLLAADPPAAKPTAKPATKIQTGEMAGYLLVPHEKVPETYNAGFSV